MYHRFRHRKLWIALSQYIPNSWLRQLWKVVYRAAVVLPTWPIFSGWIEALNHPLNLAFLGSFLIILNEGYKELYIKHLKKYMARNCFYHHMFSHDYGVDGDDHGMNIGRVEGFFSRRFSDVSFGCCFGIRWCFVKRSWLSEISHLDVEKAPLPWWVISQDMRAIWA